MGVGGNPRQGRHGFALGAGGQQGHGLRVALGQLSDVDQAIRSQGQMSGVLGDTDIADQPLADHTDGPALFDRQVDDLANAVDVRGKGGDQDLALGLGDNIFERPGQAALRGV